jgi:dTDP-4-dehydrorhamnose 3,5-epimerase
MVFEETRLRGAYVLELKRLEDERGFFARSWCRRELEEHGLAGCIAQANVSFSRSKGTLRGLHYQVEPFAETKLIRCTRGALYDVIVDLRPESPTYKQWFGIELTADNHKMIYVPESFAHGMITLTDDTEATYNVSEFYTPNAERGYRYDDPAFGIEWPIEVRVISAKDQSWSAFVEEPGRQAEAAAMRSAERGTR